MMFGRRKPKRKNPKRSLLQCHFIYQESYIRSSAAASDDDDDDEEEELLFIPVLSLLFSGSCILFVLRTKNPDFLRHGSSNLSLHSLPP
jgi:hypothetical protein